MSRLNGYDSVVQRMLETSEAEGGESAATVGLTNASATRSPEEGGGGGVTPEDDSTLGHLKLALI